jgi:rhamnogalacturonan endolyase
MMAVRNKFIPVRICLLGLLFLSNPVWANIPGGGTGTGANVTVVDNGDGTVTMANGIVSLHVVESGATINQIYYTYNNGGGTQTQQLLAGGKDGGEFYWEFGGWGGSSWAYSLVTNSGSYAEIDLLCDSATNGLIDIHFSLLSGSPGFYVTPIWSHRAQDAAMGTGEERDNIYIAPYFNWMSVNDQVQREEGLNATYAVSDYSPKENSLVTSGVLQGTYEDKYKWSADFGVERVWGWSSVSDPAIGLVGQNIGIWHVVASPEFYNGGPLKPELNDAPMVNMINGGHYYFGNDSGFAAGEVWTRVSGPYFIYVNNVTNTLTDPVQTSQALYADAKAQAAAEATAWPYGWMNNANYAPAAQRGTVAGQIVINDTYNPNATASNLWVGVEQQPSVTINNVYDFQLWMKPYEFWTKSDANGNFVISNVIAGNNYTLYAFGPGAEGMFMSKNQNGGNPGIIYNLPATPFTVVVSGGATNNLGAVTWTPTCVGPTVFEIGYPDRKGDKFRHGDDYWVGDVGPSPTAPSPVWDKFMEFPFDFPNGLNYVVGQNRWNTDWNYVQSVYPDFSGNNTVSSSTVTFNLATNPASATASLLMGIASDDSSPIYVTVNGTLLSSGNATGTPQATLPTTGWFPINDISDANIREENHGGYSDERLTFSGSLLQAGNNTINFSFRQAGGSDFSHHFMYDYIRLELTGYVPPAPTSMTAYAGNNSVLLSWPAVAGATSYNILRSTTSGGGYISITNGVNGPVCGSGPANATYLDYTAINGTNYYYVVKSVNPLNASSNSPQSSVVIPSAAISATAPSALASLTVTGTNNAVTFTWSPVPGANYYTVQRGTVVNRLGYVPFYIILSNTTTNTTYTDASGTLGCTYSYYVIATGAGGTSGASPAVTAKPVPPPPAAPPANMRISDTITSTNQSAKITWSPVSGAVGYILYRSTSPTGPFSFPGNYIQSITTTNYTDGGLNVNTLYCYMVVAMNAGGVSGNSAIVSTPPVAPASLNAYPANAQVTLVWSASVGATNYVIQRGTSSGGETTVGTTTNTSYTDTGLLNGTNYYYIVIANGPGGGSLGSPEVSVAPFSGPPAIYWINSMTASAQDWNVNSNWSNGTAYPNATQATAIVNAAIGANQTLNLNLSTIVGALSLGAGGGAFNVTANGGSLTLDNTPGQASLLELVASKGDTISAPVTVNGGLNISNASANTLTLAGTVAGATNGIIITGNVALNGTNTYSGGTIINAGTVKLNLGETNNNPGIGTGAITFQGGTLQLNGYAGNNGVYWGGLTNDLNIPAGQTGTLLCPARIANNGLTGRLTGDGTLNLTVDYVRGLLSGDWSAFTGQINVSPRSGTGDFRINNAFGYANAAIFLNSGVTLDNINASGQTTDLGELGGASGAYIGAGNGASTNPTWRIGAINTTNTYAGIIANSGVTSLVKIGTGTFILTGSSNSYSGGTTISGGTLLVNNPNGSATGSGAVNVASGGTLAGNGIISGAVTVSSGGALAPGNPRGTLTLSNNLTLAAGSTTFVQIQHSPLTNDAVNISGTLTEGGNLNATNIGAAAFTAGDSFKLFSAGGYGGSFTGYSLPGLNAGLFWSTARIAANGTLAVVSTNPPATGSVGFSGASLVWRGTGGTPNWYYTVLSSTNAALPLAQWTATATNQFDAAGNFNCTNAASLNGPPRFYLLKVQ